MYGAFLATAPAILRRGRFSGRQRTISLMAAAAVGDINQRALVSTKWLAANQNVVRIVDTSWYLPTQNRDPYGEYLKKRIPTAVFFDIEGVKDLETDLPHMLPKPQLFCSSLEALGISNDDVVVVYSANGHVGAARVWWTFRVFGFTNVLVLDGGLQKWIEDGYGLEESNDVPPVESSSGLSLSMDERLVKAFEDMQGNIQSNAELVIDARTQERFDGAAPEPRPGISSGHMPNSLCLPFMNLLNPENGTMKSKEELLRIFSEYDIQAPPKKPIVTTCGSGITAAILSLALFECGILSSVYDGSWIDYVLRDGEILKA